MQQTTATFRTTLANEEFRALWGAQILSLLGDQLVRVALAWLVYDRTDSPAWTGAAYAMTFLPWLLAGPLLSGVADRLPRRDVMVGSDLARAGLLGVMAVPVVPLPVVCMLVFVAELFAPPFAAARAALLPEVFPDDRYVVANAVGNVTAEVAQLLGFLGGGLLVAAVGARGAFALDAITFVTSAALVRLKVTDRPAARTAAMSGPWLRDLAGGAATIAGKRELRTLTALAWLCAFYVVPEGLAAPLASEAQAGAVGVGVIMAANSAGTIAGSLLLARAVRPARRLALMAPLAVLSVAPLLGFGLSPGLVGMVALLVVSGLGSAYNLPANAAFVLAVPPERRGHAFGVVQSGMYVGQGLAVLAGGTLALAIAPTTVVAGSGALGLAAALLLLRPLTALRSLADGSPGEPGGPAGEHSGINPADLRPSATERDAS